MNSSSALGRILCVYTLFFTMSAVATMEFVPLQEKAQGQSLAGGSVMNDSIHSNPAGSAFTNGYSLDAAFLFPRSFAVSVLDTRTSQIGGGLGYFRTRSYTDQTLQGGKLTLNAKLSRLVALGITGKMLWGPTISGSADRLTDVDLGTLVNFHPFTVGAVVRNMMGGNLAMGLEREWAAGMRYGWENTFFLSAAMTGPMANFAPKQFSFGAEYISPYHFGLKAGYRFQTGTNRVSYWSAGASFNSPRLSLHYAIEFPQQPNETLEHVVGLTMAM